MPDQDLLTAADIARLAGVTRATVSNWRRRHPDFPQPVGGTETSPAYDRAAAEAWLTARGTLPELSPEERVWRVVRAAAAEKNDLAVAVEHVAELLDDYRSPDKPVLGSPGFAHDLAVLVQAHGWQAVLDALITKYQEASGIRSVGTPEPVAALMATLAGPRSATVFDPSAGAGDLLATAVQAGASRIVGWEPDPALVALMQARLHDTDPSVHIEWRSGTIDKKDFRSPQADALLCNPPFREQDWDHEGLADDPRLEYGLPPRSEPELAWVQFALASLRVNGRAVILLNPAVASRPAGRRIRAELIKRAALCAIVALPPGTVHPKHIPVHIWILRHPADEGPADPRVLFVDAASVSDWKEVRATVTAAWKTFQERGADAAGVPGSWRVVPGIELLDEGVDLTPARHVGAESATWEPAAVLSEAAKLRDKLREALATLAATVPGEHWPANERPQRWRLASVADLGRWGMLSFERASSTGSSDRDPSVIEAGDVIIPVVADGQVAARVASEQDAGAILGRNLHLVRPDAERLDSWFLSGFLVSPASVRRASYGSIATKIDVRKLTVPVLPIEEQRDLGAAFLELRRFESVSQDLARRAAELAGLSRRGLADGSLRLPRVTNDASGQAAARK